MRKKFAELLHKKMGENDNIILVTGDLGYGLWDRIRIDYPDRFYNVGSAEQFMIGMSVGLALENKIPFVYSITPFLLYRPYEIIRNYLEHEKIPVKLVGGGRDKDYGNLGFSHWAEEDKECIKPFKNIIVSHPKEESQLESEIEKMISIEAPYYINLKK